MLILSYLLSVLILIHFSYAKNLLVAREWLAPPYTGWGSGNSITCAGQLIEANKQVLVIGSGQQSVSKTFTNLPDHFRVLVRLDYIVIDSWSGQSITFSADSKQIGSYTYYSGSYQPLQICGRADQQDRFERVQYSFSHTSNSITIKAETDGSKQAGLIDLQIYIDTCHQNCQTCTGANENQCNACKSGATKSSGKCVCPFGQYMYQGSCLSNCTGNLRKSADGLSCEDILCKKSNCQTCDTDNYSCSKCVGSLRVFEGGCIAACPSYTQNINGVCVDFAKKYWNALLLFKGFYDDDFSTYSFDDYGFDYKPIAAKESEVSQSDWAQFSDCYDKNTWKRFYGGFGIIGQGVSIKKTWNLVDANNKPIKHSSVLIKFYYAQVENYEFLSDGTTPEEEFVKINGEKRFSLYGGGSEMGCGRLDQGENFGWMEANSTKTNSTNQVTLEIGNNFMDPAWYEGFGIREMIIIVQRCVDNCEECGDYDGCVRCSTGYYLWRAQCYKDSCPDGSYQNKSITSKNVCNDCHSTCLTCNNGTQNDCLKCRDPLLFKSGQCLQDCGIGFYPNKPNCSPCDPECYGCFGPNKNQCTKCTGNRYFHKQLDSCLLTCPDTYYGNSSSNTCDPCNTKCLTCSGPNENQCQSCPPPLSFLSNNKCLSQCPPGFYGERKDQTCQPCVSPCTTCKNTPDTCTSCIVNMFLSGHKCVSVCEDKTYGNMISQLCENCHSLCANCSGPQTDNCLTCDDEDGYFDSTTHRCVASCPSKYFPTRDNGLQVCKLCDITCAECKAPGDSLSCLKCNAGRYLTFNNSCDKECPDYYFKDSSNFICKNCHPSCLSCINESSSGCTSCPKGKFLNQNMCLSRCPEGTYPDDKRDVCNLCHPSCASCDGDLNTSCTTCKLGKYLQDKQCSEKCKEGFYPNKITGLCQRCHTTCGTCTDKTEQSCISCKSPLYLSNNKCLSLCPDGQYHNSSTQLCDLCPSTCKTCLGVNKDECLSCSGNRFLVRPGLKCDSHCPQGSFPNMQTNECDECHLSCRNCFGGGSDQCKECPPGTYLSQNQCVMICPAGYFPSELPNLCNPCHKNCSTCTGALESQCTSCQGDRFFLPFKCLEQCPDKYFGDQATNTCQWCNRSCKTCFGVNNNQCSSCYSDKYLLKNTCIDSCPDGYVVSLDQSQCLQCESTCSTCHSGKLDYCLSCMKGWYMHTNKCLQDCPEGTFPSSRSETTINGLIYELLICKNCIENCQKCSGDQKEHCEIFYPLSESKTSDKLIFYIFIGQSSYCVLSFFIGFYLDYKASKKVEEEEKSAEAKQSENEQEKAATGKSNDQKKVTIVDLESRNPITANQQQQEKTIQLDPHTNMSRVSPNSSPSASHGNLDSSSPSPKRSNYRSLTTSKLILIEDTQKLRSMKTIRDSSPTNMITNADNTFGGVNIDLNGHVPRRQYTKFRKSTIIQNQSNLNLMSNPSLQYLTNQVGSASGQEANNIKLPQSYYQQYLSATDKSKEIPPGKGFLKFFYVFFDLTTFFSYQNENLLRPIRVLMYYCKILLYFYLTSQLLYLASYTVFAFLICIQMVTSSIERLVIAIATNVNKMLSIIFTVLIVLILYHIIWFFAPKLKVISFQEDFDWSIQYLLVLAADILLLQIIFMYLQYWHTKNTVYSMSTQTKLSTSSKILTLFLYKPKYAEWLSKK